VNFKSYPKQKDTPSRLARKQARRGIFWYNYKLSTVNRKLRKQQKEQFEEGA
jgi:hypothetical protein